MDGDQRGELTVKTGLKWLIVRLVIRVLYLPNKFSLEKMYHYTNTNQTSIESQKNPGKNLSMERIVYHKGTPYTVTYDDADHEMLSGWNSWTINIVNGKIKNVRVSKIINGKQIHKLVHRILLNMTDPCQLVDHEDRNPLNNYRYNLRRCTKQQNGRNRASSRNSSSKYLGVYWKVASKKWGAQIKLDKYIHLGYFTNEEDAARAYDEAAKLHFGEFANLNFKD